MELDSQVRVLLKERRVEVDKVVAVEVVRETAGPLSKAFQLGRKLGPEVRG
jgi:hypothetical protein